MRELEKHEQVERSINKKFRNQIWSPFIAAVKRYQLISAGDKIAVCISGGKDSMLMAKLLQMLQRYSDVPFDLVFQRTYFALCPAANAVFRRSTITEVAFWRAMSLRFPAMVRLSILLQGPRLC